ncbi:MAG: YggU family protein [Verrucomicrobia bacterium]|nr:YggU family protein [Verrucomicrobiota bacterium]
MNWYSEHPEGVIISLRVIPRASKNEVQGVHGDALKIRLQAPPLEGKANKALVKFLSRELDMSSAAIEILSGETGRNKRVLVRGLIIEQVKRLLKEHRTSNIERRTSK